MLAWMQIAPPIETRKDVPEFGTHATLERGGGIAQPKELDEKPHVNLHQRY